MEKKLITSKELQSFLGLSRSTIYRLRKEGLPSYTIGQSVRFDLDEVKNWLDQRRKVNK